MDKSSHHILLVEDDKFLAGIYQRKFTLEKFKFTVVGDGFSALNFVARQRPDLILLDILLPKLDGMAVLKKLKADPATRNIPVILLTNLGQHDEVVRGLQAGAAAFLIKAHFKPSAVVAKVKEVLGKPE
ncbi:MAG: response regulator [Candidatus Magasanikbacteria bacterium]|nr:response regulator [Candidatus Magasanikbacteria bacterium]